MITFDQLKKSFPNSPTSSLFIQHMVKEYLQTIVLGKLSKNSLWKDMNFIGGTSLRFFHHLDRFSEDLDFDYSGKDREDLRVVFDEIIKILKREGISAEIEHNFKNTDNFCKIHFTNLYDYFPLEDKRKKIWLKIDIQNNTTPFINNRF